MQIPPNPPAACPFHNKLSQTPIQATPEGSQDSRDPADLAGQVHDERGATIPCPWWRVMINEHKVTVRADGTVTMKDLRHALKESGTSFALREGAILGIKRVAAQMAGVSTGGLTGFLHVLNMDSINVLDLPKSSLMHTGDSGTLRGGFHQANLDKLLSYSSDGVNVTQADLARANKEQVAADPGESGHTFGVAEYSILLDVFGRKNEAGERFLSKEDATRIFKDNKFPEGWKKPSFGIVGFAKTFATTKKDQAAPPAGAKEADKASGTCPFLTGKPFTAEEAAQQHAEVLHQ